MKRFSLLLALSLCALTHTATAENKLNLYTVGKTTVVKRLYYSGSIAPIRNVPVISPTAGVIDKKNFIYGQAVKKNAKLLIIHSEKIENNLRDARVAYLKALEDYHKKLKWKMSPQVLNAEDALNRSKRSLNQAKDNDEQNQKLYKLGIISRDTLTQSKNASEDASSAYDQAKRALVAAEDSGTGVNLTVTKLALANAKEKFESLKSQYDAHDIKAPATGIILQPTGNSNDNNKQKSSGKVEEGDTVEYQQVIMNIGDMSGLKISFNVPEININQIHKGEKAIITGAGFPGVKLNGLVKDVAAQAATGEGGSLPTFPAIIVVPKLQNDQKKWIRAGMDAQIEIEVDKQNGQLTIPINAVLKNATGKPYVKLFDSQSKKSTSQVITFGTVTQDSVQVKTGLKAGDQVIIPSGKEA